MLFVIIALMFNMFSFSCSPRNQLANHGRKAGRKFPYKLPTKQDQPATVTAEEDFNSEPQSQVTPPFPSHPIFGAAHPPVVGGYFVGRGSSPSTLDFSVRTNFSKRCLEFYSQVPFKGMLPPPKY